MQSYDLIVVGAGHSGIEAALSGARLGLSTLVLTLNLDAIALLPCNPSIGGTAKGHLVREIDALGGEMGINIDATMIQSRMLNTGKGPAVHSLRAQADRPKYQLRMKETLENTKGITLKQAEVTEILVELDRVKGVRTHLGERFLGSRVIITSGTYLKSKIFIGDLVESSGPNGLKSATKLSESLIKHGVSLRRFKTGTPARIDERTVDKSLMEPQNGDSPIVPFSFMSDSIDIIQYPCYLTYTNSITHKVILDNIGRSAMYSGQIEGTGTRYCPSIEDKLVRFSDKPRHQLFIEPEGLNTKEMYVQGMSTSLPLDVQIDFLRTIVGLERVEIMRPGYAIEYDCIDPTELDLSLEHKNIKGLYFAGQINGSSGYEEAAAQGIMAGINASNAHRGMPPFILDRSEAYIGVLIDDLVTKGTNEPYRMMTSRSEYRLVLRQDNADLRLTPKGREVGLVSDERYNRYLTKKALIEEGQARLRSVSVPLGDTVNDYLLSIGEVPLKAGTTLDELLKRPKVTYANSALLDPCRPNYPWDVEEQIEINIKYDGYIKKQLLAIEQFKKLENKSLDMDIDYDSIPSLRIEARQKLTKLRPSSIGQASRISGVSPADISVLLVYLEQRRRNNGRAN